MKVKCKCGYESNSETHACCPVCAEQFELSEAQDSNNLLNKILYSFLGFAVVILLILLSFLI